MTETLQDATKVSIASYSNKAEDEIKENLPKYHRQFNKIRTDCVFAGGVCLPIFRIPEFAEKENSNMVIMSTHGRTGLQHMLNGSMAELVAGLAKSPVMMANS